MPLTICIAACSFCLRKKDIYWRIDTFNIDLINTKPTIFLILWWMTIFTLQSLHDNDKLWVTWNFCFDFHVINYELIWGQKEGGKRVYTVFVLLPNTIQHIWTLELRRIQFNTFEYLNYPVYLEHTLGVWNGSKAIQIHIYIYTYIFLLEGSKFKITEF